MQVGQGQQQARPTRPYYDVLLEQANSAIEDIGSELGQLEQHIGLILEDETPQIIENPKKPEEVQKPMCKLEDALLTLCNKVEGRLVILRHINARIRL